MFVAIELDEKKQLGHEFLEVNDVRTIHGREDENITRPILENDSLVWANKEKGLRWLSSAKSNSQAITDDDLSNLVAKIQEKSETAKNNSQDVESENDILFREETDEEVIERLEREPKVKVYRAMQLIDGELYPPMSAKVNGELRQPTKLGVWERADENPDMADKNGKFTL